MKSIKNNLKKVCALALLAGTSATLSAQYKFYTQPAQQMDKTYLSLESISVDDESLHKPGYIISATAMELPSGVLQRGEINRTDAKGNVIWTNQYEINGIPHRFNHIEKYTFNGAVEYLVVGSIAYSANDNTMLVALVNDNGNVLASKEFRSQNYSNLVGTKAIVTSRNTFAIVGMEGDGFTATDNKDIVVLEVDANLGYINSSIFSTTNNTYDFDMATDIVEGVDPGHYFIVGTSNKSAANGLSTSLPCTMASLIDISGSVLWSYNYSTAGTYHWDAGAEGYFDGNNFWVMGNSSINHYYNLVELEAGSGSVLSKIQFGAALYDVYGFELKKSLQRDDEFIICSWRNDFGTGSVQPFLMSYNWATKQITWQWKYAGSNNQQANFVENNWLYLRAGAQFSYFYNDIMAYAPDFGGYGMLTLENENSPGNENVMLWWKTDLGGNVGKECGYDSTFADTFAMYPLVNDPLTFVNNNINPDRDNFLHEQGIELDVYACTPEDMYKTGALTTQKIIANNYKVYPNPAANNLTIEGENIAQVILTDMFGREILKQKMDAQSSHQLDVTNISSGIYIISISTNSGELKTHKLEIIK